MNDRMHPPIQLWTWPDGLPVAGQPVRRTEPVRIGDAERDQAVSSLGDHFAAGRLTREEFDTRVDEAMAARFDRDLQPLFADLPKAEVAPAPAAAPAYTRTPAVRAAAAPMLMMTLLPMLMVGAVVAAVVLSAPWVLWGLVWMLMLSSLMGGPRRPPHYRR